MPPTTTPPDATAARADLRLVGANAEPAARAPTPSEGERERPRSSRLAWLALAAALVFAWLWLTQLERSNALEATLAARDRELAAAQEHIGAWEAHDARVRGGVRQVASTLAALEALLDAAPAPLADAADTSTDSGSGSRGAPSAPEVATDAPPDAD
ncbi:MAG: hypothetical protein R3E88_04490 [Myxococcota bacterium]